MPLLRNSLRPSCLLPHFLPEHNAADQIPAPVYQSPDLRPARQGCYGLTVLGRPDHGRLGLANDNLMAVRLQFAGEHFAIFRPRMGLDQAGREDY